MPEFDDEDNGKLVAKDQGMIRFVLGEVWSYIK